MHARDVAVCGSILWPALWSPFVNSGYALGSDPVHKRVAVLPCEP